MKKKGITLIEMIIVISLIAIFTSLTIPVVQVFYHSFESGNVIRGALSGVMSSARAIAAKEQNYAGIQFEFNGDYQQMIYILRNKNRNEGLIFEPIIGRKPIIIGRGSLILSTYLGSQNDKLENIGILTKLEIEDAASFIILFSPTGKCIIKNCQLANDTTIEYSQNKFFIINRKAFDTAFNNNETTPEYFANLKRININHYTGTIINED